MPEAYAEGPLNGTLNIETLAKVPPPLTEHPCYPQQYPAILVVSSLW